MTQLLGCQHSKAFQCRILQVSDGWDIPKKSKNNKEVAITFDVPGVYVYQCTPHKAMGMIGLVVVAEGGEVPP